MFLTPSTSLLRSSILSFLSAICFQLWILWIWGRWSILLIYCALKSSLVQCICTRGPPAAELKGQKYTTVDLLWTHVHRVTPDLIDRPNEDSTAKATGWENLVCNEELSTALASSCEETLWHRNHRNIERTEKVKTLQNKEITNEKKWSEIIQSLSFGWRLAAKHYFFVTIEHFAVFSHGIAGAIYL